LDSYELVKLGVRTSLVARPLSQGMFVMFQFVFLNVLVSDVRVSAVSGSLN